MTSGLGEADASAIARVVTGESVRSCRRFPTGLRHWVYDVEIDDGSKIVVRLAHPDNRAELAGGLFWRDRLSTVGVPVPGLIAADLDAAQPYLVLERLAGTDLGNAFDDLNDSDLAHVATTVAECQARTARLRPGSGFGYALDDTTPLHATWIDVLRTSISDSARRIESVGLVDPHWAEVVQSKVDEVGGALAAVTPRAFLHDATTKNVIVDNGAVTGIVDTDEMGFGDPLWAVALTNTSLRAAMRSTRYVDHLADAMGNADPLRMNLYTAIFALDFLSELGHSFNRDQTPVVSSDEIEHLTGILSGSLDDV